MVGMALFDKKYVHCKIVQDTFPVFCSLYDYLDFFHVCYLHVYVYF